jgi:hypothetical protein
MEICVIPVRNKSRNFQAKEASHRELVEIKSICLPSSHGMASLLQCIVQGEPSPVEQTICGTCDGRELNTIEKRINN